MATSGEEQVEPFKYKKWVLKVSIHCEGCKKKVKKVLQNIDGVYTVEVDCKKHKAVVTCNVDVEVLLRKLAKAHKNAELWPEESNPNPNPNPENIPTKTTSKNNDNKPNKTSVESDTKKEKPKVEDMKPNEEKDNKDDKKEEKCITTEKPISEKKVEKPIETEKEEANEKPKVAKEKVEKTDNNESKDEKQIENKIDNKSKQKENEPQPQPQPQQEVIPQQIMRNPPQLFQQYTTLYNPIPEPSYVVSYNTVRPSTSYGYYAPMQHEVLQQGYSYPMSYQYEGFYPHYPPPLPPVGIALPPPDDGSYDVFSDENANACKLM